MDCYLISSWWFLLSFLLYINLKVHRLITKIETVEQAQISGVVKIPIGDTMRNIMYMYLAPS